MKFKSRKILKEEIRKLELELEMSQEAVRATKQVLDTLNAKFKEQGQAFAKMRHELKTATDQKVKYEALAKEQKNKLHKIRLALETKGD